MYNKLMYNIRNNNKLTNKLTNNIILRKKLIYNRDISYNRNIIFFNLKKQKINV